MDYSQELGQGEVSPLLWKFSLPAVGGLMASALYSVVDSIFVGHGVGEIGLAAVTIVFPLLGLMMAVGMLVGVGSSTLVSIHLGAGRKDCAEQVLGNAVILLLIFSGVSTAAALVFLKPLVMLLGADSAVLPLSQQFLRVILAGGLFWYIAMGLNQIARAAGNPRMAMWTMIVGAVLNMALNPLFIFVCKLGIAGSALATVLSETVVAGWMLLYFSGQGSVLQLRLANMRPQSKMIGDIIKNGLSPFLMHLATSAIVILLNYNLLKYSGEMALAVYGVISRLSMLLFMPVLGISLGVQPIIGYNFGARNSRRVIETVKKGVIAASVVTISAFFLAQLLAQQIMSLFFDNAGMLTLGAQAMHIVLSMLPLIGFQVVGATYFQAVGKPATAMLLTASRQILLLIPLLLVLPRFFGVYGVLTAIPISDAGSAILTGICLVREYNRLKLGLEEPVLPVG